MSRLLVPLVYVAFAGCLAGQPLQTTPQAETQLAFHPQSNQERHVAPVLRARGHSCSNPLDVLTIETDLLVETSVCVRENHLVLTYEWTDRTGELGGDVDFGCTVDVRTGVMEPAEGIRREEVYDLIRNEGGYTVGVVPRWQTIVIDGDAGRSYCRHALGIVTAHLYATSDKARLRAKR